MLKYNPKSQISNLKGMTLLEILMVIFIFNILMGSIYAIYNMALAAFDVGITRAEMIPQARLALEKLSQDIMTASKVSQEFPATLKIKADLDKDIQGEENYIYYLYNSKESWPILTYQQKFYQLKRAVIDDGFEYGEGVTILKDVPFNPLLFQINPIMNTVNIQLIVTSNKESFILKTTVFPRNGSG